MIALWLGDSVPQFGRPVRCNRALCEAARPVPERAGRFLDVAQRDAGIGGDGDEGVMQGVRSDPFADLGAAGDAAHDPPRRVAIQSQPGGVDESRTLEPLADGQVDRSRDTRCQRHRDQRHQRMIPWRRQTGGDQDGSPGAPRPSAARWRQYASASRCPRNGHRIPGVSLTPLQSPGRVVGTSHGRASARCRGAPCPQTISWM